MDEYVKSKWIAALRSGDYKQHYKLANDSFNRHRDDPRPIGVEVTARCCLNVGAHAVLGSSADSMGTLPCFQLLVGNPSNYSGEYASLILMNDVEKASFSEIADWIETNL